MVIIEDMEEKKSGQTLKTAEVDPTLHKTAVLLGGLHMCP